MQVGSESLATRMSIAPWHLGILSALMRIFDTFLGIEPITDKVPGTFSVFSNLWNFHASLAVCVIRFTWQVVLRKEHVLRAWRLLQLILKIRSIWAKIEEDGTKPCKVKRAPPEFQAQVRPDLSLPPADDMASFPATQPSGKAERCTDDAEQRILELKKGKDLEKELERGYGPDNFSVQTTRSFLPDREIFRRTVLRAKPRVTFQDLSLRKIEMQDDGTRKKTSVSKET